MQTLTTTPPTVALGGHSDAVTGAAPSTPRRIKSLDGIRAVAILLVMFLHGVNHPGVVLPFVDGTIFDTVLRTEARFGVLIFFTLSGYLITGLLVREHEKSGAVNLVRFWYRRAFRIFPIFYVYLIVVGILVLADVLIIKKSAFVLASLYLWNYPFLLYKDLAFGRDASVIGHFWTLSVEEQFYCIFPFVFYLLGPRRTFIVALAVVLTAPVVRLTQYLAVPSTRPYGTIMTHTMVGVSIAIGCCWSLLPYFPATAALAARLTTRRAFIAAAVYGFLIHPLLEAKIHGGWSVSIGESLCGLSAITMIAWSVANADSSRVGRFLNLKPIAWLGTISYSLYIWQQLLFHFDVPGVPVLLNRILLAVAAVGVASLSYYLLEQPCLRLRDYLWPSERRPRSGPTGVAIDTPQTATVS